MQNIERDVSGKPGVTDGIVLPSQDGPKLSLTADESTAVHSLLSAARAKCRLAAKETSTNG